MSTRSSLWYIAALFALSPFVGEFLLGNLTLRQLPLLLVLAPMYGSGAVLVREVARKSGGGWPVMFLLAGAYALIEEGLVDQLIWNDSYAGHDYLHGPSYFPGVGTSVEVVQTILALHVVWSICVPIAIIERLAGSRGSRPWLGRRGTLIVGVGFVATTLFLGIGTAADANFTASPARLLGTAAVILALIGAAALTTRHHLPLLSSAAPRPFTVAVAALVVTSAYWGPAVLVTGQTYEWFGVGVWCAAALGGGWLLSRASRSVGWGATHRFAAAAGATLTYAWTAFPVAPETGHPSRALDLTSNAVVGLIAVAILTAAAHTGQPANSKGPSPVM